MATTRDKEEQQFLSLLSEFSGLGKDVSVSANEAKESLERFMAREVVLNAATGQYEFATPFRSTIGDLIREYRNSRGLSMPELAQRVGMNVEQIARAENIKDAGEFAPDEIAALVGRALGVGALRAMRLVKELATKAAEATVEDAEPMLQAARKPPKS